MGVMETILRLHYFWFQSAARKRDVEVNFRLHFAFHNPNYRLSDLSLGLKLVGIVWVKDNTIHMDDCRWAGPRWDDVWLT